MKAGGWTRRRGLIAGAGSAVLLGTVLLVAAFALAGCGSSAPSGTTAAAATAPDFSVTTLDGVDVSLSEYRGKPLVLAFMASW